MARKPKVYKVVYSKYTPNGERVYTSIGTLDELVQAFQYTLETGKSYERERGNKKINLNPKSISTLVKNLYNAKNNAAANGYSGYTFDYETPTEEEVEKYWQAKE